jgi:autophagy-related protein 11
VLVSPRASKNVYSNVFNRTGSLELFLHQETGVDEEAVLAYLSDGRRLRNDNIRDLAGAEDQVRALFTHSSYLSDTSEVDICIQQILSGLRLG